MFDPTPNIRRLAQSELRRAEIQSVQFRRSLVYYAIAFFVAIIALAMLAIAAFFALSSLYGPTIAAAIVGGALALIAAIALFLAIRGPSRAERLELDLADQTVDMARQEIERDFERLEQDIDRMTLGLFSLLKGKNSPSLFLLAIGGLAAWSPMLRQLLLPFLRRR